MNIYKKAYPVLSRIGIILLLINGLLLFLSWPIVVHLLLFSASMVVFVFSIGFFRIPKRSIVPDKNLFYAPADGTIMAIEETVEEEYLKVPCTKISIFMSVFNVHQNRVPTNGKVIYSKHHNGKYLVAWHPKSSLKNERHTVVIENPNGQQFLIRQIAGIVARRIICNVKEGDTVKQGDELGFILFGSRVDIFIPLDVKILVKLNEKVKGNSTIIGHL